MRNLTIGEKSLINFYYDNSVTTDVTINTHMKKEISIYLDIKKNMFYSNLWKDAPKNYLSYVSGFNNYSVRYMNNSLDLYSDTYSDLELYFERDILKCNVEGTLNGHNYKYKVDLTKKSLRKYLLSGGIRFP